MQEQLLMSQYGMGQDDASRTLEMLSELDDARRSGDSGAVAALEAQLSESRTAVDETLDETKKISLHTGRLVAMAQIAQIDNIRGLRGRAGDDARHIESAMRALFNRVAEMGGDSDQAAMANRDWDQMSAVMGNLRGVDSSDDLDAAESAIVSNAERTLSNLNEAGDMSPEELDMLDRLKERVGEYTRNGTYIAPNSQEAEAAALAGRSGTSGSGSSGRSGSSSDLASSMNRLSRALENQPQRVVVTPANSLLALVEAAGVPDGGSQ